MKWVLRCGDDIIDSDVDVNELIKRNKHNIKMMTMKLEKVSDNS